MGTITKEYIDGLITTVQNLYLSDDIPWMIGYSGGKDSTAAVQLVWMAIERLPVELRKKPIHIMNTDGPKAQSPMIMNPNFSSPALAYPPSIASSRR